MKRSTIIITTLIMLVLIASIVYSLRPKKQQSETNPSFADTVVIDNFTFTPQSTIVSKGTTVTFLNNDSATHTVVSDNNAFKSKDIEPGQSYQHTFNETGSFPYHCSIHPTMTGTITVQ